MGACDTYGSEEKFVWSLCWEETEGTRPLERLRSTWDYNIKLDPRNGMGGVDWFHLVCCSNKLEAVVNTAMNLQIPWSAVDLLSSRGTVCHPVSVSSCVCLSPPRSCGNFSGAAAVQAAFLSPAGALRQLAHYTLQLSAPQ